MFFKERKTLLAKVEAYMYQLLVIFYPLNPVHAQKYYLEYDVLNQLIKKKKCLLDPETLDVSNFDDLDIMSDSGYVVFANLFEYH